jgi:hypothetical protein
VLSAADKSRIGQALSHEGAIRKRDEAKVVINGHFKPRQVLIFKKFQLI